MKPHLYTPTPILLPVEIANSSKVQDKLMGYMDNYSRRPGAKEISPHKIEMPAVVNEYSLIPDEEYSHYLISYEEKVNLLNLPVSLYHDAFLVSNKILLTGSHLPGLYELIGEPVIFLQKKGSNSKKKVKFLMESIPSSSGRKARCNIESASYIVIYDLPKNLIHNPYEWNLVFQCHDFECQINLQINPFINAANKITLNTTQRDNPSDWVSEWCNHYYHRHGVKRVIIYNNDTLTHDLLPDLSVTDKVEVWYVEWLTTYEHFFSRCQTGALTHAYWWVGNSASYFLNFDIDEYLINDSDMPLIEYVKTTNSSGLLVDGYAMPRTEIPPGVHDNTKDIKYLGKLQNGAYKYIYRSNYWMHLGVHHTVGYPLLIKPKFWALLETSGRNIKYIISKLFYKIYFSKIRRKDKLSNMPLASLRDLYFLHYKGSRNTGWAIKGHPNANI